MGSEHLTRPGTATPFSLRLRLHYKGAHAGGVSPPVQLRQRMEAKEEQ